MSERYADYLESPEWRMRAAVMKDLAQQRCESCGTHRTSRRLLHVHHLSYGRVGNESPQDLVVLCKSCHDAAHDFPDASYIENLEYVAERHPEDFADFLVHEYRTDGWAYDFIPEPKEDRLPGEMDS